MSEVRLRLLTFAEVDVLDEKLLSRLIQLRGVERKLPLVRGRMLLGLVLLIGIEPTRLAHFYFAFLRKSTNVPRSSRPTHPNGCGGLLDLGTIRDSVIVENRSSHCGDQ